MLFGLIAEVDLRQMLSECGLASCSYMCGLAEHGQYSLSCGLVHHEQVTQ